MARLLDQIVGHQNIIHKLLEAQTSGRWPSTFLFVGPEGVGKRKVALALSQILLCQTESIGCGVCGSCQRVEKENSEGLLVVEPEKNQIKIEQSRQILDFLSLRSLTKSRIVIIDKADQLNPQAANSLLKILEEPPEDSYFFLLAPSSRHVLSTLRSRSQVVHFSPLSIEEMRKKTSAPDWALRASLGSFTRLNHLLESEEIEIRNHSVEFLKMWMEDSKSYLKAGWKELISDRSTAMTLAHHICLFLRDACVYKVDSSAKQILNPDHLALVQQLARLDQEKLFQISAEAMSIENSLKAHRDLQLTFEEFWLRNPYVLV